LFTEAVCGEGGGMIVEHSGTERKTWNSTSTSSTQIITDTCHYSVSVTLEINSLQSVLMLHPFSY